MSYRNRRTNDQFADLIARSYEIINENSDGLFQSEFWKKLGLTSREGSSCELCVQDVE